MILRGINSYKNKFLFLKKKQMFIDISSMLSGRILTAGLYFIFTLFLMHILTVEEYGQYTYYYSLIVTIPFFLDIGTNNAFVALGAKTLKSSLKKFDKLRTNFLFMKYSLILLFSIIVFLLYIANFINNFMLLLLLFGLLLSTQELFFSLLIVRKKFVVLAKLMPLRNFIALIVLIFSYFTIPINDTFAIYILGFSSIVVFFVYVIIIKQYKIRTKFISKNICLDFFKYSGWLILYNFAITLMMRLEVFILQYYSSNGFISSKELGYFSAAFSFAFILPLITTSVTSVMLPTVAQFVYQNEVNNYIKKIKKLIFPVIFSVTTVIILTIIVINIFFYEKYSESIVIYMLISIATISTFYSNLFLNIFYAAKKTKIIAKIGIYQLIINLILDALMIYFFGAIGAAFSMILVRIIGLIMIVKYMDRVIIKQFKKDFIDV